MIKMVEKRSVLYGGTIFTGNTQYTIDKGSIVYENSRIIYVGRDTGYNITAEDVVYDCKDKFIMPGLIDCHVHYGGTESPYAKDWVLEPDEEQAMVSISQAKKSLFNGFTTVRDISDNGIHLRNMINSGIISGPRIIACGRGLSRTGGHGDAYEVPVEKARNSHPWAIICDGEDEIRKGVRRLIKEGSQCIKLWASGGGLWEKERETDQHYSLKEISVMVEEATNAGIPVCAHCECLSSAMDSAIAGVVSIEHGEELNEEVLAIMKTKDISLVPTYGLFMEWFSEYDPPLRESQYKYPGVTLRERELNRIKENLQMAKESGIRIAVGSDSFCDTLTPYGIYSLKEIRSLVIGGLTPEEALIAATKNGAELLRVDSIVGTLDVGKQADIVVFNKNPLDDIDHLLSENIDMVIQKGEVIRGHENVPDQ